MGFGSGGFGTPAPAAPWGNNTINNNSNGFPPPAAPAFGFGNAPAPAFGTPPPFGSAAPPAPFGSSAPPSSNTPFGGNHNANNNNTAQPTPGMATPFGQQQQQQQPPPSTFGSPAVFGGSTFGSASAPFGSPTPPPAPVANPSFGGGVCTSGGGMNATSNPFGGAPSNNNIQQAPATPFGSTTTAAPVTSAPVIPNAPFGTSTAAPLASPFGGTSTTTTAAPATGMTFGASSSIAAPPTSNADSNSSHGPFGSTGGFSAPSGFGSTTTTNTHIGGGFPSSSSNNNNDASFAPTPAFASSAFSSSAPSTTGMSMTAAASTNNPFGSTGTSSSAVQFGASSTLASANPSMQDDNNMSGASPVNVQQSQSHKPPKMTPFGPGSSGNNTTTTSFAPAAAASQSSNNPFGGLPPASSAEDAQAKKLAELKAKLAEKKRRVEAKKAKALAAAASNNNNSNSNTPTASAASSFDDDDGNDTNNNNNHGSNSPAPFGGLRATAPEFVGKSKTTKMSLSQRNALRFGAPAAASTTNTAATAPTPRRSEVTAADPVRRQERAALDSAVSLVGTCTYMCPDEELDRRQRESDIQLLEQPHGSVHPAEWTLRDTVIKRFRRSAADYKLDVPEWIRPPDVLERVCGYLEEWIMEKDRQGPDPRFPGAGVPPSLDVYQFIWDRTRMIRKDFTLQNYVGTGGKCDARAVRCHERIARWHAMCEHQLSHIPMYQQNQSQQNIQELGQTMKTLNQFYDDSLHRSTVEVPDKDGKETRTDRNGFTHGCVSDIVEGAPPVDYNQGSLSNEAASTRLPHRLIGATAAAAGSHGTSEAEMRGMYILLTIDNDGGMEVLKYAGRLFSERREMYDSVPVQLAMSVYKAKRELNYARFFSILRAPTTPYLYACIMFKHVRFMRETAFKIMAKTYGGVSRETKESVYDQYPLKELARLLCFEDMDEARAACRHYGISMKEMKLKSSTKVAVAEIVFWKKSAFKIPKDPVKGTIITLRPKKMMRIIESKIQGATRLAICRGEVSGVSPGSMGVAAPQVVTRNESAARKAQEAALLTISKQEEKRKEQESQGLQAAEAALKEKMAQQQRAEEEKLLQKAQAKAREAASAEAALRRQQQLELERQQEIKRLEEEKELLRIQKEKELLRQKAEEAARQRLKEQQRLEALALEEKRRKEEALRRRQVEEEQRRREAEAAARKKAAELEKAHEEALRRRSIELAIVKARQEKEERAKVEAQQWQDEIDTVKKKLLLLRWRAKLPISVVAEDEVTECLQRTSPAMTVSQSLFRTITRRHAKPPAFFAEDFAADSRSGIESFLQTKPADLHLQQLITQAIVDKFIDANEDSQETKVWLIKVGLLVPRSKNIQVQTYADLLKRLVTDTFSPEHVCKASGGGLEVRTLFATDADVTAYDIGLFVIPPISESIPLTDLELRELSSRLPRSKPRVVLSLTDDFQPSTIDKKNSRLAAIFAGDSSSVPIVSNTGVGAGRILDAVHLSSERLVDALSQDSLPEVKRLPAEELACNCIVEALHRHPQVAYRDDVLALVGAVFVILIEELHQTRSFAKLSSEASVWPDATFFDENDCIANYFGGEGLPRNWNSFYSANTIAHVLESLSEKFALPFPLALEKTIQGAPDNVRRECTKYMRDRKYNECMRCALSWERDALEPWKHDSFLYLQSENVERVCAAVRARVDKDVETSRAIEFTPFETIEETPTLLPEPLQLPVEETQTLVTWAEKGADITPMLPSKKYTPKRNLDETPQEIDSAQKSVTALTPGLPSANRWKRQRRVDDVAASRPISRALDESMDFTNRLEALADGDIARDMIIGNTSLSSLIRSCAKP